MTTLDRENEKRKDPDAYPMRGGKTLDSYWEFWTDERIEQWRTGRVSWRS